MPLLGQPDLGEVADHGELLAGPGGGQGELRHRLVRGVGAAAAVDEVGVEHPLRHGRAREVGQGAAVVAALVTVLRRRASTASMAVPDTTPRCPARETSRASRQPETATPIPPWMIAGRARWAAPGAVGAGWVRTVAMGGTFVVRGTYGCVSFATVSYGSVGSGWASRPRGECSVTCSWGQPPSVSARVMDTRSARRHTRTMTGRGRTPLTAQIRRTLAAHEESQRTGTPVDEIARQRPGSRCATARSPDGMPCAPPACWPPVGWSRRPRRAPPPPGRRTRRRRGRRRPGRAAGRALAVEGQGDREHGLRGLEPARRPVLDPARPLPRLRRRARRGPDQHRPQRGAQPRAQPGAHPRHRARRQLRRLGRQVLDRRRELPLRRGQRRLGAGLARGQERPQGRSVPADLRLVDPARARPRRPDRRPVARRERARRALEPVREADAEQRRRRVRPRPGRSSRR